MDSIFIDNNNFSFGNSHHIIALLFSITIIISSIFIANKYFSTEKKHQLGNFIGLLLSLTIILWTIAEFSLGKFSFDEDLPLYPCTMMCFLMPIFTLTRNKIVYEIILFWILAGTFQAIITPDLNHNFPHYNFLKYWFGHSGLVWLIFYATFVYNYRPTFKSIFKSFGALQIYFVSIIIINYLLGANYAYLNRKPAVSSILDLFGPWPYYVIQEQLIVLPAFCLIYMPFYFLARKQALQEQKISP